MDALTIGIATPSLVVGAICVALYVHTRIRGWLPEDVPRGARKQHRRPTPLLGAAPALATIAVCAAVGGLPWLAAGLALALSIGWIDDARKEHGDGSGWRPKALGLGIACALATIEVCGYSPHAAGGAGDWLTWLTEAALVWTALFVVCNATNFLDNTDGVAVVLGAIGLCFAGGAHAELARVIALAWLAFLPFNWPRARLFLGDAGALPLGLALGCFALLGARTPHGLDWLHAFAVTALPCCDFVQVVCARLWLGFAPWVADRRHLTHIAQNLGLPAWAVAPLFAAIALGIASSA